MIDAARTLAEGWRRGRLIVAAVVDEEYASIGADALVRAWRADAGIVTEPTDLQIAVAHKGFAWMRVETHGRAAHGSRPRDGRDAILRMGRVLRELERLDRDLQARPPHPLLGTGSLHASLVAGGRELSSYPDHCRLDLERRTTSGEEPAGVVREIGEILDRVKAEDPEFKAEASLLFARPAYELDPEHPLPATLARAAAASGCPVQPPAAMSFWTDAAILGHAGTPSVLFGPGGAGLHGVEEYVFVEDVRRCRDALAAFARAWC